MGIHKLRVRVGDVVVVTAGRDRGKVGKIVRVNPARRCVAVEGIAVVKRHVSGIGGQQGGVAYKERMIDVSNVALWNQDEGRRVKVRFEVFEDGRKVRVDKKSGLLIG